tara:strand:- start:1824 stop:2258 length:435 start_codon:yes stop_codon:yes gene_type:complete
MSTRTDEERAAAQAMADLAFTPPSFTPAPGYATFNPAPTASGIQSQFSPSAETLAGFRMPPRGGRRTRRTRGGRRTRRTRGGRRPSRTGGGVDAVKIAVLKRDLKDARAALDKCRAELAAAVAELAHARGAVHKLLDRPNLSSI